jgi:magnesium transporter
MDPGQPETFVLLFRQRCWDCAWLEAGPTAGHPGCDLPPAGRSVTAVEVVDGTAVQVGGAAPPAALCVLVPPSDPGRVAAAAGWLGADAATAGHALASPHRRPLAYARAERISVIAFATIDGATSQEVHLHLGAHGLVAVCPERLIPDLGAVVSQAGPGPRDALLAVLGALADQTTEAVEELSERADRLDQGGVRLTSGDARHAISRLRHQLFALQKLWTAHHLLCAPDGTLADALDEASRRRLRHVGAVFEASGAAAAQLYAMLGDTLSRHSAVIGERLTLVTVTFLPLTVSSSFFGMNFDWMTDHIGSAAAFILLGVVLPLVLLAATLVGARRFSGR